VTSPDDAVVRDAQRLLEAADEMLRLRPEDPVDVDRRPLAARLIVERHDLLHTADGVAVAPAADGDDQARPRIRADDAVDADAGLPLEGLHRRLGLRAEVAVDVDGMAPCAQKPLQRAYREDPAAAAHERER